MKVLQLYYDGRSPVNSHFDGSRRNSAGALPKGRGMDFDTYYNYVKKQSGLGDGRLTILGYTYIIKDNPLINDDSLRNTANTIEILPNNRDLS